MNRRLKARPLIDDTLIDWVSEALTPLGGVTFRKMMGGATLYLDGTIFAIVADDLLWFKSDAASDADWDAAGCRRFTYDQAGKLATMNYRGAPDDVYDDADAMRQWAALGLAAGLQKPLKRPKR